MVPKRFIKNIVNSLMTGGVVYILGTKQVDYIVVRGHREYNSRSTFRENRILVDKGVKYIIDEGHTQSGRQKLIEIFESFNV